MRTTRLAPDGTTAQENESGAGTKVRARRFGNRSDLHRGTHDDVFGVPGRDPASQSEFILMLRIDGKTKRGLVCLLEKHVGVASGKGKANRAWQHTMVATFLDCVSHSDSRTTSNSVTSGRSRFEIVAFWIGR